ncbi:AraC family transcriptional regulator [Paenibacillus pasadenensis]|uniref:helix-turn-helix transcriptional regulator n=1 Tax=Paenibacillus pasadenensis TaxID=217090 RepID=UPI00203B17EB|nr:AraC family transcriptional regulator [Paenibacillus pasadenensis]MCM3749636.1 AraC family transcriptional regulator [Paenibacillus pasadenensis]
MSTSGSLFPAFISEMNTGLAPGIRCDTFIIPEAFGTGFIERFRFQGGCELHIAKYELDVEQRVELKLDKSFMEVIFTIQSERAGEVAGDRRNLQPGRSLLLMLDRHSIKSLDYRGRDTHHFIKVKLTKEAFVKKMKRLLPETIHYELLARSLSSSFIHQKKMDADIKLILNQITAFSYSSAAREVYLESKASELITVFFCSLVQELTETGQAASILSKVDLDKIVAAKEILLADLADPPSLIGLAKQAGINDFKLKAGFKEMYGQSVFSLLRQKRMETAYALLTNGCSVTEASFSVGYSSLSHFAIVFKQQFGFNPSELIKKDR